MGNLRVPNISFREATVADCQAIAEVHVRSWRESFSGIVPQSFLDGMSVERRARAFEKGFSADFYKMFVAEVPTRGIIGFADFGKARESNWTYEAELYAIYLLRDFQRKGIGGQFFNLGVEAIVNNGMNSMYLLALEVSPYRSFYEKMGGQIIGEKSVEIAGARFSETVYGWKTLRT